MDIIEIRECLKGHNIVYFESLDSTNRYAKENFDGEGIIIAGGQTKGRGRLSHQWVSTPEKDLTFTIVRQVQMSIKDAFIMNFYASLMIFKVLKKFGNIQLKWPNDIMLEGRKVCGLLTETENKNGIIRFYIGIGINVNGDDYPDELKDKAISLKMALGKEVKIEDVFTKIIKEFSENFEMIHEIKCTLNKWKENFYLKNEIVDFRINDSQNTVRARVLDVQDDGAIVLEMRDEKKAAFYTGEISFIY